MLLELLVVRGVKFVEHIAHVEVGHPHFVGLALNEQLAVVAHSTELGVVMDIS